MSDPIAAPMTGPGIAFTRRLRTTPWTSRIEAAGVQMYTIYNHMLLPTSFRGVEADYHHLRSAVQVWDVACERQVEIIGRDAGRLAQMLTVRDLRSFDVGRCGYAPVCDGEGHLINDPVVLRVAEDRYWFSVADSDVVLWAGGLALGYGLEVAVSEPNISPLAVQGPRAEDLIAAIFGEAVRNIKFFRFAWLAYRGHPMVVARTGWSAQGGFEIYVDDDALGAELYDELMAAGEPLGVGPGCPNLIERIEAGLLTYGTDVTRADTALEAGLDRYCSLDKPIEAIGLEALRRQAESGVTRQISGYTIDGDPVPGPRNPWSVTVDGVRVGQVSSAVWSPRLETNVALGMLDIEHTALGTSVTVELGDDRRHATVVDVPFPGASQR
ncbi:MAG: dimethylsulfoniopropionate demethylase [Ilumatobacteraceae bacterium]